MDYSDISNPAGTHGLVARLQMLTMSVLVARSVRNGQLLGYLREATRARQPSLAPLPLQAESNHELVERYQQPVADRINFRLRDQQLTGKPPSWSTVDRKSFSPEEGRSAIPLPIL